MKRTSVLPLLLATLWISGCAPQPQAAAHLKPAHRKTRTSHVAQTTQPQQTNQPNQPDQPAQQEKQEPTWVKLGRYSTFDTLQGHRYYECDTTKPNAVVVWNLVRGIAAPIPYNSNSGNIQPTSRPTQQNLYVEAVSSQKAMYSTVGNQNANGSRTPTTNISLSDTTGALVLGPADHYRILAAFASRFVIEVYESSSETENPQSAPPVPDLSESELKLIADLEKLQDAAEDVQRAADNARREVENAQNQARRNQNFRNHAFGGGG